MAIFLSVTMVFVMAPLLPMSAGTAQADTIPTADVTYTEDWVGTLEIDDNTTVKISGVNHDNTGTDYGAAIKITSGATVNLVFEGKNTLIANPSITCAGIEVEEGATVNIYGMEDSSLKVTGGKYSAGIGGIGYNEANKDNPACGNINIFSGTITAIGGARGAGIGSGYHSSASDINISGGNITALGTESSAGIGSGYGTSGGNAFDNGGNSTGRGVGYYNGGNIIISGGTVRAAAYHIDFDTFDPYDPDTLYDQEGNLNTHAAGIGGGYGASSGNIFIEGDADVTAIGCSGAAGIGTGRGTKNPVQYDSQYADCNVLIKDNAKVVAMATGDTRGGSYENIGGASIGLGRGFTLENEPRGIVRIEGNSNVYAYADAGANGIGASIVSDRNNYIPAYLADLQIDPSCTVVAVSKQKDAEREGFDEEPYNMNPVAKTALTFNDEFFETAHVGSESKFFTEDMFPVKVDIHSAGKTEALATFPLTTNGNNHVGIHLPSSTADAYYKIRDCKAENGIGVLLALSESDNGWKFGNGAYDVKNLIYEKYNITYNLNGGTNASGNPSDYAVYGPAVTLKAPSRNGYTFGGWFDNANLKESAVTTIPAGSVGDKQFWAKWTKKTEPAKVSGTLLTKLTAKGKKNLVLTWNQVKGADGYDVFFNNCGKKKFKLVKTFKGSKTTSWTKKGLKKKSPYMAYVKAFVMKDGKKSYVLTSPTVHAYTSGSTKGYTNPKSVTVKKTSVPLKTGKTYTIKASVKKLKKGKALMPSGHAPKLRYLSSNNKVASVNKSGKITAKGKGTCKVYVFTVNGASKAIKVTVK